jgi:DNA replication protein DnaC
LTGRIAPRPDIDLPEQAPLAEPALLDRDLNPQMRPRSRSDYGCPHGLCGGEGFVLDEATNTARPCACRSQRIAHARSRRLRSEIPEKFRDVAFDRNPVPAILESLGPLLSGKLRRYCDRIEEKLDRGEGLWFMGPPGTGKTTLAMLVSIHALRARRAVAIYTGPQLLNHLMAATKSDEAGDFNDLISRLVGVDLLHLEDLAAASPNDWVQQTFYTVINDRYQENRSIVFTADVQQPMELRHFLGARTASRLMEMCGEPIPMFGEDNRLRAMG